MLAMAVGGGLALFSVAEAWRANDPEYTLQSMVADNTGEQLVTSVAVEIITMIFGIVAAVAYTNNNFMRGAMFTITLIGMFSLATIVISGHQLIQAPY